MKLPDIFHPLRYKDFRLLWAGMGASYAGDRLQDLAQSWLVAILTKSSALAVGGISIIASLPQLLMPLGGVLAERAKRRQLLILGQVAGAVTAAIVGALVISQRVAPWHIYAWALVSGMIWLVSRPAFKVVLTEAVPAGEVRAAVALNSMAETAILITTSAIGSLLLAGAGLSIAFLLNALSYLLAAVSLWRLPGLDQGTVEPLEKATIKGITADLGEGFRYLSRQPRLLYPLLLTFGTIIAAAPASGLLAAILHAQGKTILSLGLLGAAASTGAFIGAIYAGSHSEGSHPVRVYAWLSLAAAMALALFLLLPIGLFSPIPLAILGFIAFSQAVWNTSRVRLVADPAYQARLQSLTTMAFTLGGALGQLWGGLAIDHFGVKGLAFGSAGLVLLALAGFRIRFD